MSKTSPMHSGNMQLEVQMCTGIHDQRDLIWGNIEWTQTQNQCSHQACASCKQWNSLKMKQETGAMGTKQEADPSD